MIVQTTTATNIKPKGQHNKLTKATTAQRNFAITKTATICFQLYTLSFQVSQPIRSGKDMLVSIDTIKCFLGGNGREIQLQEETGWPSRKENYIRTICKGSDQNHNGR